MPTRMAYLRNDATVGSPTRQLSQSTAAPSPIITAAVPMLDRSDIHLIVVLLRPTKASTGAPQPITVQPPVVRPKMPPRAPSTPPDPPARLPNAVVAGLRRSSHRAKYAATRRDRRAKRARSAGVTAKPHSMPKLPSAENQNRARPQVLARRSPSSPGPEAR